MKKRGIYLIGETGLINSDTGAGNHISVGIKYLSKNFDITIVSPEEFEKAQHKGVNKISKSHKYDTNKFKGVLRNIKQLITNLILLPKYYKIIKHVNPNFIYERASFLNFNGFVISKLLRIPLFYEVNGIMYQDHKNYYDFYGSRLLEKFERFIYSHSSYIFFIGSYGDYYKLNSNNFINTENGIRSVINKEETHNTYNSKVKIAFVGTIMKHHNFGSLLHVLKKLDNIELHLIGNNNSGEYLNENIIHHGYVNNTKLNCILENMDIGIIPPLLNKEYSSLMKLYNYGLNNCLVIAPDTYNLKYWFSDSEIVFYDKNSSDDFEKKLLHVIRNMDTMSIKAETLNKRVLEDFDWRKIFNEKIDIINSILNKKSVTFLN